MKPPSILRIVSRPTAFVKPYSPPKIGQIEVPMLRTQAQAQCLTTIVSFIKVPIWFTVMETIRRMTGTEDGMLGLTAKSLTALKGKQHPGPGTADELIPIEPSLATEGILWFDDLMRHLLFLPSTTLGHDDQASTVSSTPDLSLETVENKDFQRRSARDRARHALVPQFDAPLLDIQQPGWGLGGVVFRLSKSLR
ncbi:MAG: hypothetical protein Q9161_007739 [Pseudevernia consocians]